MKNALAGLEQDCKSAAHEYWSTDVDMRSLSESQRSRVTGPNQITDLQLLMLAHRRRGQLATFDAGISELAAGVKYAGSLLVL